MAPLYGESPLPPSEYPLSEYLRAVRLESILVTEVSRAMGCGDGIVVAAALVGFVLLALGLEREVG